MKNSWFEIDRKGLRQVQNEKDPFFIIKELVSNSFDENITTCWLDIKKESSVATIDVYDNSENGFKDLKDSYTMFAPSYKKGIVTKRGRFNVGEKFALSMFRTACITSTTGRVTFLEDGTRKKTYTKIDKGTLFMGKLPKINKSQYEKTHYLIKTQTYTGRGSSLYGSTYYRVLTANFGNDLPTTHP